MSIKNLVLLGLIFTNCIALCFAQTEEKNNWLPPENVITSSTPEVDSFLQTLNGSLRLLYCKYEGAKLIGTYHFNKNELIIEEQTWQTNVKVSPIASDNTVIDLEFDFQPKKGNTKDAEVSVLVETVQLTQDPLGSNAFINWPKVSIKQGETCLVKINKKGTINF